MKGKIILNEAFILGHIAFLLNDAPLNYLYGKDVFLTGELNHNKYHIYGILGLLGAHPNDYELDNSIKVFVMSDSIYAKMKNGSNDKIINLLESKLNAPGQLLKDLLIITRPP